MAAIPVTLAGVIADLYGRTITGPVRIMGELSYSDRGVGGGPLPPGQGGGGGEPPGIWPGPGDPDFPGGGGGGGDGKPPGIWGPNDPRPTPPIYLPPNVPPALKPPEVPPPGTATAVPGNWPTTGIVPPEYIVVQYPGIGPVVVTAPPHAEPA